MKTTSFWTSGFAYWFDFVVMMFAVFAIMVFSVEGQEKIALWQSICAENVEWVCEVLEGNGVGR